MLKKFMDKVGGGKIAEQLPKLSLQKDVTPNSIQALFKKAAENHSNIYYINRFNRVDVAAQLKDNEISFPHMSEAKSSNIARTEKPGRLIAAFSRWDQAVHFYLNPEDEQQGERIRKAVSEARFAHDNHKNLVNRLHMVKTFG